MQVSDIDRLRRADDLRRQAMLEADLDSLNRLLADDLTWTHSSGVTESKAEFLSAIKVGTVVYSQLDIEQDQIRRAGDVFVHNGILRGSASREGKAKDLNAKFLSVWKEADGKFEMMAWQSTNFGG
jgi:ketosteroid isomerase-like protein